MPQDVVEPSRATSAQEPDEAAGEFIDLPYWEGFLIEGLGLTVQPEEEGR